MTVMVDGKDLRDIVRNCHKIHTHRLSPDKSATETDVEGLGNCVVTRLREKSKDDSLILKTR